MSRQSRQLAAVSNNDWLAGLAAGAAKGLNLLDNVHTAGDAAKHNMLAIQPVGLHCTEEELQTTMTALSALATRFEKTVTL